MGINSITETLKGNAYPGRGIIIGESDDGTCAVAAYFIMGRSENSRNRRFEEAAKGIKTTAVDFQKVTDPSLVIYNAVKQNGDITIVTNGDQTDTIDDFISGGGTFEEALRTRTFEPDPPILTPRISGIIDLTNGFDYKLSILKSFNSDMENTQRFFFEYEPAAGIGHLIHTYKSDGSPVPSYEGEPKAVKLSGGIEAVAEEIWASLDEENKISLFVRFINLETKELESKIINKYS